MALFRFFPIPCGVGGLRSGAGGSVAPVPQAQWATGGVAAGATFPATTGASPATGASTGQSLSAGAGASPATGASPTTGASTGQSFSASASAGASFPATTGASAGQSFSAGGARNESCAAGTAGGSWQSTGGQGQGNAHAAEPVTGSRAQPPHAVVIGAGIAGLCAAWELQRCGWRVTVLEQAAQVGGAVQTVRREGWQVECGPNTMMVSSREFEAMLAAIGLEGKIIKPDTAFKKRFLVREGELHAVPRSLSAFVRTPLFSTGAKLRLLWNLLWGGGRSKVSEDESLGSYFRRQFGREMVDVAIRPVITGVYAGDVDRLSLRHAFPLVWAAARRSRSILRGMVLHLMAKRKSGTGFRSYMISFEGGLQALPNALAAALATPPVTTARVQSISRSAADGSWRIAYTTAGEKVTDDSGSPFAAGGPAAANKEATGGGVASEASGSGNFTSAAVPPQLAAVPLAVAAGAQPQLLSAPCEVTADALVLAAPSFAVAQLPLPQALTKSLGALAEIEYPPLANVALGYRRQQVRHALDGFGAVVAESEKAQVLGVLFSSSIYPQVAPADHVLLTCFIGGTRAPDLARLPGAELVRHAHTQASALLGIEGQPVFTNTAFWPRAIPQVAVGYGRFLDGIDTLEAEHPSLLLVGNYRGEVALGKCAVDAILRARQLAQRRS